MNNYLQSGKVLVVYGPRQSGKTTLINHFLEDYKGRLYKGVGEDRVLCDILESRNLKRILSAFSDYQMIYIDEAQIIHEIGTALKMIIDARPDITIIATGSSSFDLANRIGEPLTGRMRTITLFPLSILELRDHLGGMDIEIRLEELLIYGTYPEIFTTESSELKRELLITLRDSYLLKDILSIEKIKSASLIFNLLKLLAFQIGNEVSLNELSSTLGIAKQTVERYLDILEKGFVICRVNGFSRNLRKEVTSTARYFFWDNGVRNAIINNFNPISSRDDIGALWENFLFMERWKSNSYHGKHTSRYFWRTYDGKEIDLIEEYDGSLAGYEFKWSSKKKKEPALWKSTYPEASWNLVSRDLWLPFVCGEE